MGCFCVFEEHLPSKGFSLLLGIPHFHENSWFIYFKFFFLQELKSISLDWYLDETIISIKVGLTFVQTAQSSVM